MNTGKQICEMLKSVRKEIALNYGLNYEPAECDFEGDCAGFCEKCDSEIMDLEHQLMEKSHENAAWVCAQFYEDVTNRSVDLMHTINHFQHSDQTLAGVPVKRNRQEGLQENKKHDVGDK